MLLPTGKFKSGVGRLKVAFWHIHGTNEKVDLDAKKQCYSVKYCLMIKSGPLADPHEIKGFL